MAQRLVDIDYKPSTFTEIRGKIEKHLKKKAHPLHIVSLNPEIVVLCHEDLKARQVFNSADQQAIDGIGIQLAARILSLEQSERLPGVDLLTMLLQTFNRKGLSVLLIGGKADIADKLAKCYEKIYTNLSFKGIEGFVSLQRPKSQELAYVQSTINSMKPDFIFISFGSPQQEKWIYNNKQKLGNSVLMGVGGAFNMLSGELSRAPKWQRGVGLEWLYRLVQEPWRWKRQMRLITFVLLVLKQKFRFKT